METRHGKGDPFRRFSAEEETLKGVTLTAPTFATKIAPASLKLSTYISLYTYGYRNVYELGPLLDVKTTKLDFGEE